MRPLCAAQIAVDAKEAQSTLKDLECMRTWCCCLMIFSCCCDCDPHKERDATRRIRLRECACSASPHLWLSPCRPLQAEHLAAMQLVLSAVCTLSAVEL